MKVNKAIIPRVKGQWCLEYNCWPEDHPGCTKREDKGCAECSNSIFKITAGKSDGIELVEKETIQ